MRAAAARAASRRRRLARLRTTAPPILLGGGEADAGCRRVLGARAGPGPPPRRGAADMPLAAARNSARRLQAIDVGGLVIGRRRTAVAGARCLGGQALAALGAAAGQDLLAVLGGHPQAEAVTALTHQFARLIGPLHGEKLRQSDMDRHGPLGLRGKAGVGRGRGPACQPSPTDAEASGRRSRHQRSTATAAHIASIAPKGQAPCRKP